MTQLQSARRLGRPPVQAAAVMRELRDRILTGHLAPGSQVKKRSELEESLGVSQVTIQAVMNDLMEDGFLRVLPGKGTFVADHPPHLCHFALVLPFAAGDVDHRSKFYTALRNTAGALPVLPQRKVSVYWGAVDPQHPDTRRLYRDLERHRLAGLVFAGPVFHYRGTPLLAEASLPRIAINIYEKEHGIASVFPDFDEWLRLGLGRLHALGRHRVALFANTIDADGWHGRFTQAARERGLTVPARWMQFQSHVAPAVAIRHAARTLWSGPASDRPDGLLIADDNLAEQVVAGLAEEGCDVGRDLHVIAHANFPVTPAAEPAMRGVELLGFDVADLVNWSIDLLARGRRGQSVPSLTLLPPRFG